MTAITKYMPGEFCWTNLATSDVAATKKFYTGVFGWTYRDIPVPNSSFAIAEVEGGDACGIYPISEEEKKLKIPSHWMAYISVDNVDAAATKAKSAGAKVLHSPEDVMEAGRFAVLQDPTGAVFAIWQAKKHKGATLGGVPGTVCWRELTTPNLDVAAKFYSTQFGWTGSARDMGNMTYHMFSLGEEGVGGMMLPQKKEIPPHWLTYWVVNNTDTTITQAKKFGAQVVVSSTAIPGMGRFAVLVDPQGATFGIFETSGN